MIVIIGAGPAGLTLGYLLAKKGVPVHIIEAAAEPGGLGRSMTLWEQQVEIGPHFFSDDANPAVKDFLLEIIGNKYSTYDRLTRILTNGQLLSYPPNVKELMAITPVATLPRYVFDIVKQQISPVPLDGSVETYITRQVGKSLYESFFKTYTEKLWGIGCEQITEEYGKGLIGLSSRFSVVKRIKDSVFPKPKVMHRQCLYPNAGFNTLWKTLEEKILEKGGTISYSSQIQKINFDGERVTGLTLATGQTIDCSQILSTIPTTRLMKLMPQVPDRITKEAEAIQYRSIGLVYMRVKGASSFKDQCIYTDTGKLKCVRLTNFSNFKAHPSDQDTIILAEYWTDEGEPANQLTNEEIVDMAKTDLANLDLFADLSITDTHIIRVKNALPKPDLQLPERLQRINTYLESHKGLKLIGRNNSGKFNFGIEDTMYESIMEVESRF